MILTGVAGILLDLEAVGVLTVASTVALVSMGIGRAALGEPLLYSKEEPELGSYYVLAHLYAAAAAGTCAIVSIVILPSSYTSLGLAASLAVFGVTIQDCIRYEGFSTHRPRMTAAIDGVWLLTASVMVAILVAIGRVSATTLLAVWGIGACLASWTRLGRLGDVRTGIAWFRRSGGMRLDFGTEYFLRTGLPHILNFVLAGVLGPAALGAYRLAQFLFGPTTVLNATYVAYTAPSVRALDLDARDLSRRLTVPAVQLCVVNVVIGTALLGLPSSLASRVVAEWSDVRNLLAPVTVHVVAISFSLAGVVGLRTLGRSRLNMGLRAISAPAVMGAGLLGALLGGIFGAAVGVATVNVLFAIVRHWLFETAKPRS